jgi:hypothetical protein
MLGSTVHPRRRCSVFMTSREKLILQSPSRLDSFIHAITLPFTFYDTDGDGGRMSVATARQV